MYGELIEDVLFHIFDRFIINFFIGLLNTATRFHLNPYETDAIKLTASEIYDYIRKRAGSRAVTESITVFGRYLSNVPDIQKVHVASGTAYYVKYRKNER